jgi:hypothetical protein
MSDRRAIHTAAGIYLALWLAGIAGVSAIVPCDATNSVLAQEPAPEPQPAPEITAEIVAPEVAEPGTFVPISLKTNGSKVNVRWLFDGKADPAHFRPVNGRSAVVTALAGQHTVAIFGVIDETPVLVQQTVKFGEPDPPTPPTPISQLVTGETATKLAVLYRAMATLLPPGDFWTEHNAAVAGQGIVLSDDAVKELHRRLGPVVSDPAKLATELVKIADELAKSPSPTPGPAPIPVAGLHVLIIEETDDRNKIPQGQLAALQSTLIPAEVKAKGGQFRQYDDDPPIADPLWSAARSRPRTSLPWIIVSNGTGGFEGPLPASIDDTLALIRRFEQ